VLHVADESIRRAQLLMGELGEAGYWVVILDALSVHDCGFLEPTQLIFKLSSYNETHDTHVIFEAQISCIQCYL